MIVLKIAVIAYTLFSTGNASETLFASRSLHDPAGYAPSDLTGAMCFLLFTNGDESKLSCVARFVLKFYKCINDNLENVTKDVIDNIIVTVN